MSKFMIELIEELAQQEVVKSIWAKIGWPWTLRVGKNVPSADLDNTYINVI